MRVVHHSTRDSAQQEALHEEAANKSKLDSKIGSVLSFLIFGQIIDNLPSSK